MNRSDSITLWKRSFASLDEVLLGKLLSETYWNKSQCLSLKHTNFVAMSEVVRLAGLDPDVATAADMDAECRIYECLRCHKNHEGRAALIWSSVVRLIYIHIYIRYFNWKHLREPSFSICTPFYSMTLTAGYSCWIVNKLLWIAFALKKKSGEVRRNLTRKAWYAYVARK